MEVTPFHVLWTGFVSPFVFHNLELSLKYWKSALQDVLEVRLFVHSRRLRSFCEGLDGGGRKSEPFIRSAAKTVGIRIHENVYILYEISSNEITYDNVPHGACGLRPKDGSLQ